MGTKYDAWDHDLPVSARRRLDPPRPLPTPRSPRTKRSTKDHCRGNPAHPHVWTVVEKQVGISQGLYSPARTRRPPHRLVFADKCQNCGKERGQFVAWLWVPDWVRKLRVRSRR